jgi:hypothetical protein
MRTRVPGFVVAARSLLEGNIPESVAAVSRIVGSGFKDPEGLYYLSRHLAHVNEVDSALALFERVIDGGFFPYPALARDPWLRPLHKTRAFTDLLHRAETLHLDAGFAFSERRGDLVLGVGLPS